MIPFELKNKEPSFLLISFHFSFSHRVFKVSTTTTEEEARKKTTSNDRKITWFGVQISGILAL